MADKDGTPATERDSDADAPRPIPRDEEEPRPTPAPKSAQHDSRALTYPTRSRLRAERKNTLRIDADNSVRVPAVDFVTSDKPTKELVDMERLEHLERLGKAWLKRRQLKPESSEQD